MWVNQKIFKIDSENGLFQKGMLSYIYSRERSAPSQFLAVSWVFLGMGGRPPLSRSLGTKLITITYTTRTNQKDLVAAT